MRLFIYLMMVLAVAGAIHCISDYRHTEAVVGVSTAIILFYVSRIVKKEHDEY